MSRFAWEWEELNKTKYYNYEDYLKGNRYKVIDLATGEKYDFPTYKKVDYQTIQITPSALDNQEFFNWLCKTSPDGWRLVPDEYRTKELIDICIDSFNDKAFVYHYRHLLTKEQYTKIIGQMPSAIEYVPEKFIDEAMVKFVLDINPKNIFKIPSSKIPEELREDCYKKLTGTEKKQLVRYGYMEDLMTSDRLNHLINSRLVLNKKRVDYEFWRNIPKEIITERVAKLMFDCNSGYVRYIPEKYLSNEMIKQALEDGNKIISVIPKKFMTKENVEMALKKDPNEIFKLPEDIMAQYLNFAISLNGKILGSIPHEKKTEELCRIAFDNDYMTFKYIPHKFKTQEMCIIALKKNPKLIRNVPITILDNEFLATLKELGIVISKKDENYVEEAIRINSKINMPEEEGKTSEKSLDISPEIANIYIQDVHEYFSSNAQAALESIGIYTLGELLSVSSKKEFAKELADKKVFSEIIGTIKILRCKYLNEDPLIDLNDEELDLPELFKSLGFSTRATNCLMRSAFCRDSKSFLEKLSSPSAAQDLKGVRNLGRGGSLEVMTKVKVVLDYYRNKENQDSASNPLDELKELNQELQRLIAIRDKYDSLINGVISKIQEKLEENSIGGNAK